METYLTTCLGDVCVSNSSGLSSECIGELQRAAEPTTAAGRVCKRHYQSDPHLKRSEYIVSHTMASRRVVTVLREEQVGGGSNLAVTTADSRSLR